VLAVDKPASLTLQNATLQGGGLNGDGTITIQQYVNINTKGTTLSVGGSVVISSNGEVSGPSTILMSGAANFEIQASSTITASDTLTFQLQSGTPTVTVNGNYMGDYPVAGRELWSNVAIMGSGTFTTNGTIYLLGSSFQAKKVQLVNGGVLYFSTETFSLGSVTGNGVVNVTTQTTPASSLGVVAADTLIITNGGVNVQSFTVSTLEIDNGMLMVSSPSTATTLNFNGGTLQGSTVTATNAVFAQPFTKTLDSVTLMANTINFSCATLCTYQLQNNAMLKSNQMIESGRISMR